MIIDNYVKNKIVSKLICASHFNEPFFHIIIDNFLPEHLAKALAKDFIDYKSDKWFCYKNKIEDKKLLSDWRQFPETTYQFFSFLNSPYVLEALNSITNTHLYPDPGLHGGGWHVHASGGKLNPHLDYSIHPTLHLQRKLNLILYLCEDWRDEYGGHFGLWGADAMGRPVSVVKEVPMAFNRAVLFDTTQNSWHGMSREVKCPKGFLRKSLAVYYLQEPTTDADIRSRALFAPTESQKNDESVKNLIRMRSDDTLSKKVYEQP